VGQSDGLVQEETLDVSENEASDLACESGRKLFQRECSFIWAAAKSDDLPPVGPPEIAFAGRSNVGKSSLLNALTGRSRLARTSNTPGRTQQLNFFDLAGQVRLVDMPGYGYAAVSKEKVEQWSQLMRAYLRGRTTLLRVFLLIDARHGLKDGDETMMVSLDKAAISYQVVLTKLDEIKPGQLEALQTGVLAALKPHPAAYPHILPTSARTGEGMAALRATIARLLAERSHRPIL
jgi:GTP-binding protein